MTNEAQALLGFVIALAAAGPVILFWRRAIFARSELKRLAALQFWRERFQEQALLLVDAERLPALRLEFVRFLNDRIESSRMASVLVVAIDEAITKAPDLSAEREPELFGQPCDSSFYAVTYVRTFISFVMAVSFNNAKLGPRIRERTGELFALLGPDEMSRFATVVSLKSDPREGGLQTAA